MIMDEELIEKLLLAKKLLRKTRESKKKLYSIYAPEVECIHYGKAYMRYEFGCKVSMKNNAKSLI